MSTWLSYHNQGAAREAASSRRFPPAAAAAAAAVFVYPHGVRSAAAQTHKTDPGRWPLAGRRRLRQAAILCFMWMLLHNAWSFFRASASACAVGACSPKDTACGEGPLDRIS